MKSVQLNGVLVCETDIGREVVKLICKSVEGRHKIHSLGDSVVYCEDGYMLYWGDGTFAWVTPPKTITPNSESPCPRQQAANVLREAYTKCEELGMDVCSYGDGSLSITYQPEEVVY